MTKIKDLIRELEAWAPTSYQESYDNAGLIVGQSDLEVDKVLIALDITEAVMEEAIAIDAQLIIAHHPLIFKGLKKINGSNFVERCIIKAIKHEIAIYAIHTNLDHVATGVNKKIADTLGLVNSKVLVPRPDALCKLTTFVPVEHTQQVLSALYEAGAGAIGKYDNCSFRTKGVGTFRPGENTKPYIGNHFKLEEVEEERLEIILPSFLKNQVLEALRLSHPYEEVAYYLHELANLHMEAGAGMIGELPKALDTRAFIALLKKKMGASCIRHSALIKPTVRKVAICGGSGSFLLGAARRHKADVLVSADFKYHDFFNAEGDIIIADIGHYESEQFTKELIYEKLNKKFANIALRLTEVNTNPIIYSI